MLWSAKFDLNFGLLDTGHVYRSVSTLSILLLLWALQAAPFVHSHVGEGRSTTVHSHRAEVRSDVSKPDPGFTEDVHEGRHVDLFASVSDDASPDLVCLTVCPESAPPEAPRLEDRRRTTHRVRGPPRPHGPARAPPA